MERLGLPKSHNVEVWNSRHSSNTPKYSEYLHGRLHREGYLLRDCRRLVNQDRNVVAACMLAHGHADGMVTGVTRHYNVALEGIRLALDPRPCERVIGVSVMLA